MRPFLCLSVTYYNIDLPENRVTEEKTNSSQITDRS